MHLTHQTELTDALIDEARGYEGLELRIEQWNTEATADAIRHYAWGVGDDNPLWCDPGYAERSRFGTLVALPSFLHSVYSGDIGLGLVGIQPIHAGYSWEYLGPIRRGDAIRVVAAVGPTKVLTGRRSQRFLIQTTLSEFFRQDGALVARLEGSTFRIPRSGASGGLSYEPREPRRWSEEELEQIRVDAVSEQRRGAETRYWDDVAVGDEVPSVVKGPIELMTMTAYYAGRAGSPGMKGVEMKWRYATWAREAPERLPSNYDPSFFDERTSPSYGHQRAEVAHEIGMPGAYANGGQRASWISHAVTNWMGDDGDLVRLDVRLRRPDVFGDLVRCSGRVVEKLDDGRVRLELASVNQLGETTASAVADVRLPTRSP